MYFEAMKRQATDAKKSRRLRVVRFQRLCGGALLRTTPSRWVVIWTLAAFILFCFPPSSRNDVINHAIVENKKLDSADVSTGNKEEQQRIVVLVGPHKTGSSSVQLNLWNWTRPEHNFLSNWVWPFPYDKGIKVKNPSKEFYPLVIWWNGKQAASEYPKNMIKIFADHFLFHWSQGKNLVIACEGFDSFLTDPTRITKLLNIMPLNDDFGKISFVVNYRSPRFSHLVSLFHETQTHVNQTLSHWICQVPIFRFRPLNSLGLVQQLVDQGQKTVLVDMAGVSEQNYDMNNVVACDILKVPCYSKDKTIVGLEGMTPAVDNVSSKNKNKRGTVDLSVELQDAVERLLKLGDCDYLHLLKHDLVKVLHDSALLKLANFCEEHRTQSSTRVGHHKNHADNWWNVARLVKEEVGC